MGDLAYVSWRACALGSSLNYGVVCHTYIVYGYPPHTSFHGIMPFSLNWEKNNDAISTDALISSFVKMKYANI